MNEACSFLLIMLLKNLSTRYSEIKASNKPSTADENKSSASNHLGTRLSCCMCIRSVTMYKAFGKKASQQQNTNADFHLLLLCILLNRLLITKGIQARKIFQTKNR